MSIRVVLAEDHGITRQGLRRLLEQTLGFEVVGEADNGLDAVDLARDMHPDVAIMDITMPGLNGVEATRKICQDCPGTRVVILSMHSSHEHVSSVLKAGASGYVLKDGTFEDLCQAVRAAAAGGTYLTPSVASLVVTDFVRQPAAGVVDPTATLTPREREVLQLVAEGKTTKQIALHLHKSSKAIEANRRRLMAKLGVNSVAELVRVALKSGLTSIET